MQKIKDLNKMMKFIENEQHYYAAFYYVARLCVIARDRKTLLWNEGVISDNENLNYSERIERAYKKAVQTHKNWVIKRLQQSSAEHTVETIVSTIYNDIFQ